jgi:hypothetical protein
VCKPKRARAHVLRIGSTDFMSFAKQICVTEQFGLTKRQSFDDTIAIWKQQPVVDPEPETEPV